MKKLLTIGFLLILLGGAGFGGYLWHINLPLVSPQELLSTLTPFRPVKTGGKIVLGFLPYWNMKYVDDIPLRHLTHLAYFAIDLNSNGEVRRMESPGVIEPGLNKLESPEFSKLHRQLKLTGKKSILTVKAFDQDQISAIVNNPNSYNRAIETIMSYVLERHFDGVNVDFEYVGNPDPETKKNFTRFMYSLNLTCKIKSPGCEISVDTFADAASKNRLWDMPALKDNVDYFVIMTYDYYRSSSSQAGPVAPLRGGCSTTNTTQNNPVCLEYDVLGAVADTLKAVPPEKIVLGVPFYGYEWQTASRNFLANTYPKSGGTATYKRIQEIIGNPDRYSSVSALWSDFTLSPYLVYEEDGGIYQIHYEDVRSLGLKLDLINQNDLRGLGIWAVGYELPYHDLWQIITQKFSSL